MKKQPIILTLDAGGTNFIFSAMQEYKEIVEPVRFPSNAHDLDLCLETIYNGFKAVSERVEGKFEAISFAFPGPADYDKGIIGNLPNFEAFNDAVALGPMLEDKFKVPVFINNDGNLYAYGEALSGYLPGLNQKILDAGGIKQFKNLVGVTLGTGFGGGIVMDSRLATGDNSCGAEVHNTLNKFNSEWNAEESVSTRAIRRVYSDYAGLDSFTNLMPKEIAEIIEGNRMGDKAAAEKAFEDFGEALGSSLANFLTLIDGIAVLGGGITAAWDYFAPAMFKELSRHYMTYERKTTGRLSFKVYNLEDEAMFKEFALGKIRELPIPGTGKSIAFDDLPRVGVGKSKIGASNAIALGAYAFALQQMKQD